MREYGFLLTRILPYSGIFYAVIALIRALSHCYYNLCHEKSLCTESATGRNISRLNQSANIPFVKVAATDMRYFARSKFSRSLVYKKSFSLI